MGEEIIADQECHEHKVIDDCLEIVTLLGQFVAELHLQVLAEDGQVKELELGFLHIFHDGLLGVWVAGNRERKGNWNWFGGGVWGAGEGGKRGVSTFSSHSPLAKPKLYNLAQQCKVRLVTDETKHDEIGILTIHAVAGVRLVAGLGLHVTNVLHDLVLALAWDFVPGEVDFQTLPERVLLELLADVVLDQVGHLVHEDGAGGDAIGVKQAFLINLGDGNKAGGGGGEGGGEGAGEGG